jgi:hypothetical protein
MDMASNHVRLRALALPLVVTVTSGCYGTVTTNPEFVSDSDPTNPTEGP